MHSLPTWQASMHKSPMEKWNKSPRNIRTDSYQHLWALSHNVSQRLKLHPGHSRWPQPFYLGVEFTCCFARILFSQRTYATQILKEFGMQDYTPSSTLMTEGLNRNREHDSPQVDARRFQKLVRMLIYLVNIKPKITFATGVLSRFMHDPWVPHLQAANRILQYTNGTLELGTFYEQNQNSTILGFTDFDWANCKVNRK